MPENTPDAPAAATTAVAAPPKSADPAPLAAPPPSKKRSASDIAKDRGVVMVTALEYGHLRDDKGELVRDDDGDPMESVVRSTVQEVTPAFAAELLVRKDSQRTFRLATDVEIAGYATQQGWPQE